MAHKIPFFLTGANAKIKVNGKTMAMCTGVRYSVKVNHATPHILGMFEAVSQDPLSYSVTGEFSIIRYTAEYKTFVGGDVSPDGTTSQANGIGKWRPNSGLDKISASLGGGSFGGSSRADQSLDPSKLWVPQTFDIEIFQKGIKGENGLVAKIRNCRIIASDFDITKRGLATQRFTFQAIYVDEDSFNAGVSGVGQQFG